MKHTIRCLFLGLALCLVTLVGAVLPAANANIQSTPNTDGLGPATQTFNITIPSNGTSPDFVQALGYDASKYWQEWATVEIWTGGSSRKPVNFGDIRGKNLSDKVFDLLDDACPSSLGIGTCCNNRDWKEIWTNGVTKGYPDWKVERRRAWVRTEDACWGTEGIRTVLAQLVADTLRAYASVDNNRNCYEITGEFAGIYCNMPQLVRVNLPWSFNQIKSLAWPNYWHIETRGIEEKFTKVGKLRPCHSRHEVDNVMDKYAGDLVREYPKYKGKFSREARVIINGYKVCTNEE